MYAISLGLVTLNQKQSLIEAYYPWPLLHPEPSEVSAVAAASTQLLDNSQQEQLLSELGSVVLADQLRRLRGAKKPLILCILHEDSPPESVAAAYLKLHLLSHRLVRPNETDLSGIFEVLPNLAWTNQGPIDLNDLAVRQLQARKDNQPLSIDSIDKFPRMADYVVPTGVRIADTARVRLGAYVGEGTTIMQEGFINFNAGTEGPNMVEGRISAGVWVAEGSDLGGGSSTMGTLSGGGDTIIQVGKNCLIGANAGIGISLGDQCLIEAGLYITAGTKVLLLDSKLQVTGECKAAQLSGKDKLLFRRNSLTGAVECLTNKSAAALNLQLHQNN